MGSGSVRIIDTSPHLPHDSDSTKTGPTAEATLVRIHRSPVQTTLMPAIRLNKHKGSREDAAPTSCTIHVDISDTISSHFPGGIVELLPCSLLRERPVGAYRDNAQFSVRTAQRFQVADFNDISAWWPRRDRRARKRGRGDARTTSGQASYKD